MGGTNPGRVSRERKQVRLLLNGVQIALVHVACRAIFAFVLGFGAGCFAASSVLMFTRSTKRKNLVANAGFGDNRVQLWVYIGECETTPMYLCPGPCAVEWAAAS